MFGYIFPDKPELKVKEFELFRAYYCGLCKALGENCGLTARFVLNYDSAFLGMLLSSFNEASENIAFEKCIANPIKKKPVIKESSILKYASDINIILAYYKLKDDYEDDRSPKALAMMGVLKSAFNKSIKRNMKKGSVIKNKLEELSKIEKAGCKSIDEAAEPFAKLTEEIFAYKPVCDTENKEQLLRWFGYNIGKWIYIIDAYDDLEKDIAAKSFNPILGQFCYNNEKAEDFKNRIKDNVNFTLTYTLSEAGKAYELLELKKNASIIENIVFGGMYNKTLQIINKRSCKNNEKPL
ncbi:hypothetical protein OXPF_30430 [Oxobacter pfennigii]|uniref:Uncharacterized protein n=1 Tax=Oxobacter pfennigii TaxID=36849 RepID=A0A0P8W734_9CLOT|nr:DUF5685 family protein [Oxobacter pfennigii]KPU43602.1 hypothetical protein OXPF_30430 [Oxobacter pfennigii]